MDKHVVADGRRRKHLSAKLQTKMGDVEGKYGRCLGRGGGQGEDDEQTMRDVKALIPEYKDRL